MMFEKGGLLTSISVDSHIPSGMGMFNPFFTKITVFKTNLEAYLTPSVTSENPFNRAYNQILNRLQVCS